MSSPQPRNPEDQQQGQAAIGAALLAALTQAWLLLDVTQLAATLPTFTAAVQALARKYGQASAYAALQHYRAQRLAAGAHGTWRPAMPAPVDASRVDAAVQWATRDLWHAPEGQPGPFVPDVAGARDTLGSEVERLVLNQGRDAVVDAVKADPKAKGWARVPHPDESLSRTCAFCLLLATRGAVYKSEATASFKAHNGCHCTAEPQFSMHYEPTATVRAAQALYAESTKNVSGSKAKQLAFRRAVEGRKAPTVPEPAPKPAPALSPAARDALLNRLERSVTSMRGNNKTGVLSKAIAASEARIRALQSI